MVLSELLLVDPVPSLKGLLDSSQMLGIEASISPSDGSKMPVLGSFMDAFEMLGNAVVDDMRDNSGSADDEIF